MRTPARAQKKQPNVSSRSFEKRTTETLAAQNETLNEQKKVLELLVDKLDSPILNGGYDDIIKKISKIDDIEKQLAVVDAKVTVLSDGINHPETGLYVKVKQSATWITWVSKGARWFSALIVVGIIGGIGKLLYDVIKTLVR